MKLLLKSGLVAAIGFAVIATGSPAQALISGPLTAVGLNNKCLAGKIKCAIKKKACLLGCYAKAAGAGLAAPDSACTTKCRDKFDGGVDPLKGCFEKLEGKLSCLTTDDTRAIEAKIDGFVESATAQLSFPIALANGKCGAAKIKSLNGYNKCVLGIYAKAAAGTAADQVKIAGCDTKLKTAYQKDDDKYGPLGQCETLADAQDIINSDNLFIDDLLSELGGDMNTQRCTGDTSVTCTTAPGGGGCPSGTCEFFFGANLPLSAGGVATCVTSQWNGSISGTANQQTGASTGTAAVISKVYLAAATDKPCPKCVGDGLPNDGVAGGHCDGGTRNTLSCDSNSIAVVPAFGATSMDCPPSGGTLVATLPIDLTNTDNGTSSITLSASSPTCNGAPTKKCACGVCSGNTSIPCKSTAECTALALGTCGFTAGQPAKPNACVDDTTTGVDGTLCVATGGGEGTCPDGPIDTHCRIESFRGCVVPADCPVPGDTCLAVNRECFLDNGIVGGAITATGSTTTPTRHASRPTFASTFCIAPTGSTSVNSVAGLPGPGRLQLGGVSSENGDATTCPTQFNFLPTSKGPVLDTGWTGISHDATVGSGGKVTVAVTGCAAGPPNCGVCTYTGPIANPNTNP
jgi:hypothetical protein